MASGDSLAQFDAMSGRAPATNAARLDVRNEGALLDFSDSIDERIELIGSLPARYAGVGLRVGIAWACSTATSGEVLWRVEYERRPFTDLVLGPYDLDVDQFATAVEVTDSAPSVNGQIKETAIVLTPAQTNGALPGELFRLRVTRVSSDGADTVVGDAEMIALSLQEA